MNTVEHEIAGYDPDAVVCRCGRRFEFSEWGGTTYAKTMAEQHAAAEARRVAGIDFEAFELPAAGASRPFWVQLEGGLVRIAIPETPDAISLEDAKTFLVQLADAIAFGTSLGRAAA